MRVKDAMQAGALTVSPDDMVRHAAQRMRGYNMRHLPVVAERYRLVGIVTDRDLRQVGASDAPRLAEYELTSLLDNMTVQDIMTTQVYTVQEDTSIARAIQLMLEHKIACLPVVDDHQTLLGIITTTDLLRVYVQQYAPTEPTS
jgi:acetoin utilization protein AcuB